ncbi:hypothetical protein [Streptomyces sp. cmx-4-9]|uniref:hypothetical protein n=1 Tax=Streptomyces sp. cmx-4-9 TaxID=2790941 RepID=UPI00397F5DEE
MTKKSRRSPNRQPRGLRATAPRSVRPTFIPGRFGSGTTEAAGKILTLAPPDALIELALPFLLCTIQVGKRANVCVDSVLTLHHAYQLLGLDSEVWPVTLEVLTPSGATKVSYGRKDPYWEGSNFYGHCLVELPGRTVDPTIQQFPELTRQGDGPFVGRTVDSTDPGARSRPGAIIYGQRGDVMVRYTVCSAEARETMISGHPMMTSPDPVHQRSAVMLVTLLMDALRSEGIVERARKVPHQRVVELLDVIGAAPMEDRPAVGGGMGDLWFNMPDGQGGTVARHLNELLPQ